MTSHTTKVTSRATRESEDNGKVRIGNFTPLFPPPRETSDAVKDSEKVRIGNFTPLFPPPRTAPAAGKGSGSEQ